MDLRHYNLIFLFRDNVMLFYLFTVKLLWKLTDRDQQINLWTLEVCFRTEYVISNLQIM